MVTGRILQLRTQKHVKNNIFSLGWCLNTIINIYYVPSSKYYIAMKGYNNDIQYSNKLQQQKPK